MQNFIIGLILGLFVGSGATFLAIALCMMASQRRRRKEG